MMSSSRAARTRYRTSGDHDTAWPCSWRIRPAPRCRTSAWRWRAERSATASAPASSGRRRASAWRSAKPRPGPERTSRSASGRRLQGRGSGRPAALPPPVATSDESRSDWSSSDHAGGPGFAPSPSRPRLTSASRKPPGRQPRSAGPPTGGCRPPCGPGPAFAATPRVPCRASSSSLAHGAAAKGGARWSEKAVSQTASRHGRCDRQQRQPAQGQRRRADHRDHQLRHRPVDRPKRQVVDHRGDHEGRRQREGQAEGAADQGKAPVGRRRLQTAMPPAAGCRRTVSKQFGRLTCSPAAMASAIAGDEEQVADGGLRLRRGAGEKLRQRGRLGDDGRGGLQGQQEKPQPDAQDQARRRLRPPSARNDWVQSGGCTSIGKKRRR